MLRHRPQTIGLTLDENGWADVDTLIRLAAQKGRRFDRRTLDEVVAQNDKKRFSYSDDGNRIRANQGHSVNVDLGLPSKTPPDVLYHGTASRFLQSIFKQGLTRRNRHHVHLSAELETAKRVGRRHGKLVVLRLDTRAMVEAGHSFYLSENGVWLTDHVPPEFFTVDPEHSDALS